IIFLAVCMAAIYVELEPALRPVWYKYFALNSPTFEDGTNNAKPLIYELERYKLEFQHYPLSMDELSLGWLTSRYKYEPHPAEKPREYMLSFRKRWSTQDWYCYYSGDGAWLRSSSACWDTVRSTQGLKRPLEDYH
ncbi:MAG TPA: hypothetical protein VK249_13560, partial [Anaerolineales bacterium]|nr:hypothetical protein [Anaerolineales bacterium]